MSRYYQKQREDEPPMPTHTHAGERIPPVHKPWRRTQCQWVTGIGWVLNPTGRRIN